MQSTRQGCSTSYRALSSIHNVARTVSRHVSSKGKAKAVCVENDVRESENRLSYSTQPEVRSRPSCRYDVSWVQGEGPSLPPDATSTSTKEGRIQRRKKWRPQDSYPQPAFPDSRTDFHRKYLSGPRLQPLNTPVTEVVEPLYHRLPSPWCYLGIAPKKVVSKYKLIMNNSGNPPKKRRRRVTSSGKLPAHRPVDVPLPLSNGHGDFAQRADRCRQVIQQKHTNTQGLLDGLMGRRERYKDKGEQGVAATSSHSPRVASNTRPAHVFNQTSPRKILAHSLTNSSRRYTSDTQQSRESSSTPQSDASNIEGFSQAWKSEQWRMEEWRDAWDAKSIRSSGDKASPSPRTPTRNKRRPRPTRFSIKETALPLPTVPTLSSIVAARILKKRTTKKKLQNTGTGVSEPQGRVDLVSRLLQLRGSSEKTKKLESFVSMDPGSVPTGLSLPTGSSSVTLSAVMIGDVLNQHQPSQINTSSHKEPLDGRDGKSALQTPPHFPHNETIERGLPQELETQGPSASNDVSVSDNGPTGATAPTSGTLPVNLETGIIFNRARLKALLADIRSTAKRKIISELKPRSRAKTTKQKLRKIKGSISGELKPLAPREKVLKDVETPHKQRSVARLSHGLDRALFNQSVHWLQDPHSRVFNFSPTLQTLPSVTDFAFERLPDYVRGCQDEVLHSLAVQHSKQFSGTTSSLTKLLSHIYFLISGDRKVNISTLSMAFMKEPKSFTQGLRVPATFILHRREVSDGTTETVDAANECGNTEPLGATSNASADYMHLGETSPSHLDPTNDSQVLSLSTKAEPHSTHDGSLSLSNVLTNDKHTTPPEPKSTPFVTYALDGGDESDTDSLARKRNVLLWFGTMAEKFLTLSEQEFDTLLRKNPVKIESLPEERGETYRYAKSSKFVMRSQLDCQDSRLPGTGVFDLKTRAVLPIRIDQLNYQANSGYLIRRMTGLLESFEREYYDLIRSAFLKYNFQARIGNMDGIFLAYHNTARIFGFQYVPVKEMEERLYGPGHPGRGDRVFEKCVGLMEAVITHVVEQFPTTSLSCTVETPENTGYMVVWATPSEWTGPSQPILEFKVTISHTLNRRAVSSRTAINRAHEDWTVQYTITPSVAKESQIWRNLRTTQARRFKLALPDGMSEEDLTARLANVDWGAGLGLDLQPTILTSDASHASTPNEPTKQASLSKFASPSKRLRKLRRLALAGKEDMKREEERSGRQVVWGIDHDASTVSGPDVTEVMGPPTTLSDAVCIVEHATPISDIDGDGLVDIEETSREQNPEDVIPSLPQASSVYVYSSAVTDRCAAHYALLEKFDISVDDDVEAQDAPPLYLACLSQELEGPDSDNVDRDIPLMELVELCPTQGCTRENNTAGHKANIPGHSSATPMNKIRDIFATYHL